MPPRTFHAKYEYSDVYDGGLLTERSHLRATRQGVEEVKKHKTGESHGCGSRSYDTFGILKAHVRTQGLVKPVRSTARLNIPFSDTSHCKG